MSQPQISYTRDKQGRVIAAHCTPARVRKARQPAFGMPYGRKVVQSPLQRLQSVFA